MSNQYVLSIPKRYDEFKTKKGENGHVNGYVNGRGNAFTPDITGKALPSGIVGTRHHKTRPVYIHRRDITSAYSSPSTPTSSVAIEMAWHEKDEHGNNEPNVIVFVLDRKKPDEGVDDKMPSSYTSQYLLLHGAGVDRVNTIINEKKLYRKLVSYLKSDDLENQTPRNEFEAVDVRGHRFICHLSKAAFNYGYHPTLSTWEGHEDLGEMVWYYQTMPQEYKEYWRVPDTQSLLRYFRKEIQRPDLDIVIHRFENDSEQVDFLTQPNSKRLFFNDGELTAIPLAEVTL